MSIPEALPWHTQQWLRLGADLDSERLHHAILLQGSPGLGKLAFAERAAAALLCEASGPGSLRPCESCRSCLLVAAGSHPDRLRLTPAEDRKVIDVGQVRERIAELSLTPHYASRRVIVVNPADALNRHAANTLLKTLEEPPGGTIFLLASARPATLPATVRSRCTGMRFTPPSRDVGLRWLDERGDISTPQANLLLDWCGGAPIAALDAQRAGAFERYQELVEEVSRVVTGHLDPIKAAAAWRSLGLQQATHWHLQIAHEAMRINALADSVEQHHAVSAAMQGIGGRLNLARLDRICEEILELRSALERQLNPGDQLALEGLATSWRDAGRPGK